MEKQLRQSTMDSRSHSITPVSMLPLIRCFISREARGGSIHRRPYFRGKIFSRVTTRIDREDRGCSNVAARSVLQLIPFSCPRAKYLVSVTRTRRRGLPLTNEKRETACFAYYAGLHPLQRLIIENRRGANGRRFERESFTRGFIVR